MALEWERHAPHILVRLLAYMFSLNTIFILRTSPNMIFFASVVFMTLYIFKKIYF